VPSVAVPDVLITTVIASLDACVDVAVNVKLEPLS